MSKNDEQMDKQIVWHTHIQNAKSQLIELEKARVRSNENHNKTKEKIIRELAQALEDSGMPTGLISEEIVRALADEGYGVTKRYINMCLDKKYKTKLQNIEQKELGNGSENDNKNAPEQTILVDNTGYEEAFEDIDRPNVITESERVKKIEKRIDELAIENEILRRENKVLKEKEKEKEKTQPEHALELQEKFYDGSGLLDVKAMEKISEEAGRDIETMLKKYNGTIQVAVESGQPVPVGTYIIAKANMKLVPIRITVDFDKRKIMMSLWEEKLQSLNV